MRKIKRYLADQIKRDLEKKMVFISGPRQVGKTTLALDLCGNRSYLNWDIDIHREKILKKEWPPDNKYLVLDEIHKYRNWRNLVKGLYDFWKGKKSILVTGSAKLDYYRRGGDSLQGRYHFHRLHPLSAPELKMKSNNDLMELFQFGGFPEPFFSANLVDAKRWSREYRTRLIREEIYELEKVHDLGNIELLAIRLPELTGSPLSVNSLREDLQVSHRAVTNWLRILETLYFIFRLSPFGNPIIRAVKKEQKHYHFDWTLIQDEAIRFENMVACHLLKWVHFKEDSQGLDLELRYFRDVDLREVDFVLLEDKKPVTFIECKLTDRDISPGLRYLKTKFPKALAWQISLKGTKDYESSEGIRVAPAIKFLNELV